MYRAIDNWVRSVYDVINLMEFWKKLQFCLLTESVLSPVKLRYWPIRNMLNMRNIFIKELPGIQRGTEI